MPSRFAALLAFSAFTLANLPTTTTLAHWPPVDAVIGNSVVVLTWPWAFHPGDDMAVANSLPLGLSVGAGYGETAFQLQAGDRLTLLADGVVEARNLKGELFGFERAAELVQQSRTADEIAADAQRFGQQDDITVVTVIRMQ